MLERQVCLIETGDEESRALGTGFLVGPDLLLTAHHNLTLHMRTQEPDSKPLSMRPPTVAVRFGFAVSTADGAVVKGERFALATKDWLFAAPAVGYYASGIGRQTADDGVGDEDLALVRLADKVGLMKPEGTDNVRGWVDLRDANAAPEVGSSLAIFQHANGGPLKVSVNTESIIGFNDDNSRLLYRTDTLPGASGGPCFDADWKFLAVHQSASARDRNYNMGVPYAFIQAWLKKYNLQDMVYQEPPEMREVTISRRGTPASVQFRFEAELAMLVEKGEGQQIEFKERTIESREAPKLIKKILITVAAFMNSKVGGNLLIGITDDMRFVGVEQEYEIVDKQRKDWNGYELWLGNVLRSGLSGNAFEHFSISRYHERAKDICVIRVQPANAAVFVGDDFYIRRGNQNEALRRENFFHYVMSRWPGRVERGANEVSLE